MNIKRGYTLVEILVVLGIVLILSALIITIVNPSAQRKRAQDAVIQKAVADISGSIEIFKAAKGRYPNESDVFLLQPYVSNGYTVYNVSGTHLIGFHNPGLQNEATNSVYWDSEAANNGCLQSVLTEKASSFAYWSPGSKVSLGDQNCSPAMASIPADDAPPAGGSTASGNPTAPTGNEYNQGSNNPRALVAHYKMDEASGNILIDSSSKGNNATVNGSAAVRSSGMSGTSIDFNGTNQYGRVQNMLTNPRSITISAWVNPTDVAKNSGGTEVGSEVISLGDNVAIRIFSNRVYAFYHNGQTWPGVSVTGADGSIINKGWTHITYVFNDAVTNDQILYINGVQKAISHADRSIVYAGLGNGTSIGNHANPTTTQYYFKGKIDEIKVYNYTRTPEEVKAEYDRLALALATPRAHWALNETSGTSASDSVNSNTATCTPSAACPSWVAGKIGNALSFDGGDFMTASGSSTINVTEGSPFTISAWVRRSTTGVEHTIVNKQAMIGSQFFYNLSISSSNKAVFSVGSQNIIRVNAVGTTNIAANTWYLVTGVYNGTQLSVYVDGKLETNANEGFSSTTQNTAPINIGQMYNGTLRFNGQIDEVRFFNKALSVAEIEAEYKR